LRNFDAACRFSEHDSLEKDVFTPIRAPSGVFVEEAFAMFEAMTFSLIFCASSAVELTCMGKNISFIIDHLL